MTVQGYYNVCRDSYTRQDLPRGLFFDQDWADLRKVMPVASGGIHAGQMHLLLDLFGDDVVLQFGGDSGRSRGQPRGAREYGQGAQRRAGHPQRRSRDSAPSGQDLQSAAASARYLGRDQFQLRLHRHLGLRGYRRRLELTPKEHAGMMTNPVGRITQGQFSYLPALSDAEITLQIEYGLGKGYAWSVEYTDDPHPRNTYWEMFGLPMFDLKDAAGVMMELQNCRKAFPRHYIRLMAFDSTRGVESTVMSFIVNRPSGEPGFGLRRQEAPGRTIRYTVHSYATDRPETERNP